MDYHALKHAVLSRLHHIGKEMQGPHQWPKLSPDQRRRINGKNFMTDDRWSLRLLAKGNLFVEIAYGRFLEDDMFGVTVFCVRDLAADAPEWDHTLSGVYNTPEALEARLRELNEGGRERLAALTA